MINYVGTTVNRIDIVMQKSAESNCFIDIDLNSNS